MTSPSLQRIRFIILQNKKILQNSPIKALHDCKRMLHYVRSYYPKIKQKTEN